MPARSVLLTWRLRSTRLLAEAITVPVMRRCPAAPVSASNHSSTNVTLSLYSANLVSNAGTPVVKLNVIYPPGTLFLRSETDPSSGSQMWAAARARDHRTGLKLMSSGPFLFGLLVGVGWRMMVAGPRLDTLLGTLQPTPMCAYQAHVMLSDAALFPELSVLRVVTGEEFHLLEEMLTRRNCSTPSRAAGGSQPAAASAKERDTLATQRPRSARTAG